MNEGTEARQKPHGRTISVQAAGDTADEIELAALDEARKFFGDDRRLEVVPDYGVITLGPGHPLAATGKRYYAPAGVPVRTVED